MSFFFKVRIRIENYQWMQSEGMTTETPEDDRYVSVAKMKELNFLSVPMGSKIGGAAITVAVINIKAKVFDNLLNFFMRIS